MQLPPKSSLVGRARGYRQKGTLRSRYSWPPRGVPIDPSSQALPDSQLVMLPVLNALNQPSNPKLITLYGVDRTQHAHGFDLLLDYCSIGSRLVRSRT